jgi:hypothetical protein
MSEATIVDDAHHGDPTPVLYLTSGAASVQVRGHIPCHRNCGRPYCMECSSFEEVAWPCPEALRWLAEDTAGAAAELQDVVDGKPVVE